MAANKTNYGLLAVLGSDAKKFLQGQLTCDMGTISPSKSSMGAHCNPQGRVISLFYVLEHEDDYYLLMLKSMVPITMQTLKKYAVFFKVTLEDASVKLPSLVTDEQLKQYFNIQKNIPRIHPETSGKFLPHELGLNKLNAISFNKGCYTGQEIIARMEYRGKLKSTLFLMRLKSQKKPVPGEDIYCRQEDENKICGSLVDIEKTAENNYAALVITTEQHAKIGNLFTEDETALFTFQDNQL